jgi:hypothetical protein
MKKRNKKQCPDVDVSDECLPLAGIYVLSENALEITDRLMTAKDYHGEKEVNQDIAALDDLLIRIKKHAYDETNS